MEGLFGFIGCGKMGGALARAAAAGTDAKNILLNNRTQAKADFLASEIGARTASAEEIAGTCRLVFLGVKPQNMEETLAPLRKILAKRKDPFAVVSMAAGLETKTISAMAGGAKTVRIMPNLPVTTGEGVVLICADEETRGFLNETKKLLGACGSIIEIPEEDMDAASAVSGCGPAFVFAFLDALSKGAAEAGLSRETATELAARTILGSARLFLQNSKTAGEWISDVCSPGGTTVEGMKVLREKDMEGAASGAVKASYRRSLELKKR